MIVWIGTMRGTTLGDAVWYRQPRASIARTEAAAKHLRATYEVCKPPMIPIAIPFKIQRCRV